MAEMIEGMASASAERQFLITGIPVVAHFS
jgi:hypothetical protein